MKCVTIDQRLASFAVQYRVSVKLTVSITQIYKSAQHYQNFQPSFFSVLSVLKYHSLGTDGATKLDGFSEKFQTAFHPSSHIWKIMMQIFFRKTSEKKTFFKGPKSAT